MTDFAFEKGDDITIKLNGKIIGGERAHLAARAQSRNAGRQNKEI